MEIIIIKKNQTIILIPEKILVNGHDMEEFQLGTNAQNFYTFLKQIMRKQILDSRGICTRITAHY